MKMKPIAKLQTEIAGYGFTYSLKTVYITMALFFAGVIITGGLFKLHIEYIIALGIFGLAFLPIIVRSQYRYLYEQRRFSDVSMYIEQMIYNFKKQPKIITSLQAVQNVFAKDQKSHMADAIKESIRLIREEGSTYDEALMVIYKEFPCSRVRSLHRFLIKIERTGGEYQSGINVLLEDIGIWIERTYKYQADRKHAKVLILVSIILATLLCFFIIYMLTNESLSFSSGIYENIVYQVVMFIFLASSIILYTITTSKLNGSWLVKENSDDDMIKKKFKFIHEYDAKKMRMKTIKQSCILLPFAGIAVWLSRNILISLLILMMILLIATQPARHLKSSTNFIEREVKKAFGDWMRDLMIEIPLNNVRVAIRNSLENAPYVLQDELELLIKRIDEDMLTISPYQRFFEHYQLPEIKRPVQMLYSLNKLGKDEVDKQLNDLIKQNNTMISKSEDLRNEDAVTMTNAIVALPMLSSAGVLAIVMFLFFIVSVASMASQVLG